MGVQLVPYMTAVVAVHALLLSLGGLLVVNTLTVLTKIAQLKYENAPQWIKELVSFPSFGEKRVQFRKVEGEIPRAMKLNAFVGSLGILYSLATIAFLSDIPQPHILVVFSLILVVIQVMIFFDIVLRSMDYLGWWVLNPLDQKATE